MAVGEKREHHPSLGQPTHKVNALHRRALSSRSPVSPSFSRRSVSIIELHLPTRRGFLKQHAILSRRMQFSTRRVHFHPCLSYHLQRKGTNSSSRFSNIYHQSPSILKNVSFQNEPPRKKPVDPSHGRQARIPVSIPFILPSRSGPDCYSGFRKGSKSPNRSPTK